MGTSEEHVSERRGDQERSSQRGGCVFQVGFHWNAASSVRAAALSRSRFCQ
jgi:hypothetical protein